MTKPKALIWALSALLAATSWGATTKTVKFNTGDEGEIKSITDWGEDATWVNYYNARKSAQYAGSEIDFVRIGFYLHKPYNDDGSLSDAQIEMLDSALKFADMIDSKIPIMLSPNNEKGISDWYKKSDGSARIDRWFNVMQKSREYIEANGHQVVAIEVFNEPDWKKWNMGHKDDLDELLEMCGDWGITRVGPSTLGTQQAEDWFDEIDSNLEAGSTHTLSGTMEQYIDFIDTVKDDKKLFMNPEVHALAEVIVGTEEGIDSACWWDQINEGRAHFMRACQGRRLAYVAVEKNWSAACVYRGPDGKLYGFASTNERDNGIPTSYKFVCEDQAVTYCMEGDPDKGIFRKKGESFEVQAKVAGKGKESITRWFTIVPKKK
ncbi:hypothetical protein P4E94_13890 [Pontiellaceae bacterium B12219]|nr:hypothetical protein [Pontiellaceae bacterium B12219]